MIFKRIVEGIRKLCGLPRGDDTPPSPKLTDAEINATLDAYAKKQGREDLDWRASIVDLLVLLDIGPAFGNRKLLWEELSFEGKYTGSGDQNEKLIEEVQRRFANGELD